jgi:muramidase (phage lysozyme)
VVVVLRGRFFCAPNFSAFSHSLGRYQFIKKTWRGLAQRLHFSGFTPVEQDLGAADLIRGRSALEDVIAGRFDIAIRKCAKEWASLPGAGYGQRENALVKLQNAYTAAGGTYA